MIALGRLAVTLGAAALALLFALPARAQVALRTEVSARKVEVGQSFQVQLIALGSGQPTPSDPRLAVPTGIEVAGPSIGSQTQVSMSGGRVTQRIGISATWTLTPRRTGTFRIGPPSVSTGGRRASGEAVTVEVVPAGTLPRPPPRRGFDPFGWLDPFGSGSPFPRSPLFEPPGGLTDEPPPVPEELRVERAPDPVAFVRAVVTPKRPVVGEQVTLEIYAYGSRGRFREANPKEPSRADFLTYSIVEHAHGEPFVQVPIEGVSFVAVKLRELALFPLRAGRLVIGPLTMTFEGPGYRARGPVVRSSQAVVLEVVEPPLAGRPPGYELGDVGEFTLDAGVDPKRIVAGDAVSVVAKLEGSGNLPLSLDVPQKTGVEWLEPSLTEEIGPDGSVIRGQRLFTYVVKLHTPGALDLGALTLPYFDSRRREYAVLRAPLGVVQVDPGAAAAQAPARPSASAAPGPSRLLAAAPRAALGPEARPRVLFTDDLRFWLALLGMPVAIGLAGAGIELGRRLSERHRARRSDPGRLAGEALRAARAAAGRGQAGETAAGVERALFLAIEAGTGLRGRALLRDELEQELTRTGVPRTTVDATLDLLARSEAQRFRGEGDGEPAVALVDEARRAIAELARPRKSG